MVNRGLLRSPSCRRMLRLSYRFKDISGRDYFRSKVECIIYLYFNLEGEAIERLFQEQGWICSLSRFDRDCFRVALLLQGCPLVDGCLDFRIFNFTQRNRQEINVNKYWSDIRTRRDFQQVLSRHSHKTRLSTSIEQTFAQDYFFFNAAPAA